MAPAETEEDVATDLQTLSFCRSRLTCRPKLLVAAGGSSACHLGLVERISSSVRRDLLRERPSMCQPCSEGDQVQLGSSG